jgi:hypothetical protein
MVGLGLTRVGLSFLTGYVEHETVLGVATALCAVKSNRPQAGGYNSELAASTTCLASVLVTRH